MKHFLLANFFFLLTYNIFAAEKLGIAFPEHTIVNKTKLVLNGLGVRKATWFKVKVYVGALYLPQKSQNINEILHHFPKKLVMHFVRDVAAKKLIGGWNDAFKNAFKGRSTALKKLAPQIAQLNQYMIDIEKNQKIVISFTKEGVLIQVNGAEKPLIAGEVFAKALISVWFVNPGDKGLRDGLQGKK